MISYESQRVFFDNVLRMYREYLFLYRFLNHGTTKGCVDFEKFYWDHVYLHRHSKLTNTTIRI